MNIRVLVLGLSGVLHPEHEAIDAARPLRWLPLLEELLNPWNDVRLVVTSSRKHTPKVDELRPFLGALAPRLFGYTFHLLPEEDAIAASVRLVNRQLEHMVLSGNNFNFARQCLNHLDCDPSLGISAVATHDALSHWLQSSSTGYCD